MQTDPVARQARTMTRAEVIRKAIEKRITWQQAADICQVSPRHLLRLRQRYELYEIDGLRDRRTGKRQPTRISGATVEKLCRLKRDLYSDFSVRHFHQFATERHGLKVSYTWSLVVLQSRGLAPKAASRGKYRRRRERRPMVGMLIHQDGSTHEWLVGLAPADLIVTMDDADGRILHGQFVAQEGTQSSLQSILQVLRKWGRFCEFYTDRGSHYCRTSDARQGPDEAQDGQVSRVLKTLGIRQILARSPEARGRSERAFGTIQGRLPQELRLAGIKDYDRANRYLHDHFIPDFNRRFVVTPAQSESAFVRLAGMDLDLLVSATHERVVQKDNTVAFERLFLQLPPSRERRYVRCPVIVHELVDGTLAVSYQGKRLARFDRQGVLLTSATRTIKKAA
jgi:hypothetical protein